LKRLGAAITAKAAADLAAKAVDSISLELGDKAEKLDLSLDFLEAAEVVVDKSKRQQI
jgi:hypothetical protein